MKKTLAVLILFVLVFGLTGPADAFTTTLDFFGGAALSFGDNLRFPKRFVPVIETRTFETDDTLRELLNNSKAPYSAIAAVAYDIDWDLPDWETSYPWLLEVDFKAKGATFLLGEDGIPDTLTFSDLEGASEVDTFCVNFSSGPIFLGETSLQDFFGASQEDVIDALASIPLHGYDSDIGGYLINGNLHSGEIYLALEEGVAGALFEDMDFEFEEEFDVALVKFGGRIRLTAIPEPASLLLLGTGLMGFVGLRRRKI